MRTLRAALDDGRVIVLEGKRGAADETAELLLAALTDAD
jgi:hypothetical protein